MGWLRLVNRTQRSHLGMLSILAVVIVVFGNIDKISGFKGSNSGEAIEKVIPLLTKCLMLAPCGI